MAMDTFSTQLIHAVEETMQSCSDVCALEDTAYWHSFPEVRKAQQAVQQRLLSLVSKMASYANPGVDQLLFSTLDTDQDDARLQALTDVVDTLLEKVDSCLDFANATPEEIAAAEEAQKNARKALDFATYGSRSGQTPASYSQTMEKPQVRFSTPVDNSAELIFCPRIRHKPNAIEPLPLYHEKLQEHLKSPPLSAAMASHIAALGLSISSQKTSSWPHPYEAELNQLSFSEAQMERVRETMFQPLKHSECEWIDSIDQLRQLSSLLETVPEYAIDLEHHDFRSYLGFTCLMQISTRSKDFLIDTLALRDELHVLNSSMTDPNIVKVLHGADRDILWLQRDFGLYIVNMFDTGQAARSLELPRFSLQFLLSHYCDVKIDKSHQMSDWRIRPLSSDQLLYARMDTHFLLYIYDRMRNELNDRSAVKGGDCVRAVLERSRRLCLQVYTKPMVTPFSHKALLARNKVMLSAQQQSVFRALYVFRDCVARQEDESCAYVLAASAMVRIARAMPKSESELLELCPTLKPLLRHRAHEIIQIIQNEKVAAMSLDGVESEVDRESSPVTDQGDVAPDGLFEEVFVDDADMSSVFEVGQGDNGPFNGKSASIDLDADSPPLTTGELFQKCGWVESKADSCLKPPCFLQAGANITAMISSSMFGNSDSDSDSDSNDSGDSELRRRKVATVRNSLNDSGLGLDTRGFSLPDSGSAEIFGANSAIEKGLPCAVDSEETAEKVPQSMSEIYRMSNENRRRNQEKKRLRAACTNEDIDASTAILEDGDISDDVNGDENSDAVSFMKSIGWLKDSDKDLLEEHRAQNFVASSCSSSSDVSALAKTSQQRRRNRGSNSGKLQTSEPFSYKDAAAAAAAAAASTSSSSINPSSRKPFTPYSSDGRSNHNRSQASHRRRGGGRNRAAASITSSSAKPWSSRS